MFCAIPRVKVENILFQTCLSSLCSKYFPFLLPHLVQNRMLSSGDGVASSSTSQSLLLFWQLLPSTLCRSQVTGSTAPLFGRQGFRYSTAKTFSDMCQLCKSIHIRSKKRLLKCTDVSLIFTDQRHIRSISLKIKAFAFVYWCLNLITRWLYWSQIGL